MRLRRRSLVLMLVAAAVLAGCGDDDFGEVTVEPAPGVSERGSGHATPGGADGDGGETTREGAGGNEGNAGPRVSEEDLRPQVGTCRAEGVRSGRLIAARVGCDTARAIVTGWSADPSCAPPSGRSRSSCTINGFRCLSNAVGRGIEVTCTRPERTVGFIAPRS